MFNKPILKRHFYSLLVDQNMTVTIDRCGFKTTIIKCTKGLNIISNNSDNNGFVAISELGAQYSSTFEELWESISKPYLQGENTGQLIALDNVSHMYSNNLLNKSDEKYVIVKAVHVEQFSKKLAL
jgi:hypothetical protein